MSAITKVLRVAKKDIVFTNQFCSIPGNEAPKWYAAEIDKAIFTACYVGWLVGKYGAEEGNRRYRCILDN